MINKKQLAKDKTIAQLKKDIQVCKKALSGNQKYNNDCYLIVEVGAQTVTVDSEGVVAVNSRKRPKTFTQRQVDQLCGLTFTGADGQIMIPMVYSKTEWYAAQIKRLEGALAKIERNG